VLQTRFDETAKQHKLMREKNRQLEYEMAKRYQAEQELEKQRTLRIRSDRLRSLGEMAAGIAHELNQPLMGVKGMSELILLSMNRTDQVSYGRIKKNAEIIMEQADRMVHIIQHVRLFAREAGNIEKSIEDINEVVRSGIGLVQEQFKYHGIVLKMKLSPRSIFVFINPFSLEEVILNLSGNAKDAVEDKKKLNPEAEYVPTITISTWQTIGKNSKAYLEIRDNGMGISDDIKSKIFDPFFTTKAPDKGTGLGLSITRSIVKEFNGEIILESNEGEGCVFTIIFPVYVMEETYKGSRDV
jgi:C4-dicarboxylate-specific signal transduction histidine kinase